MEDIDIDEMKDVYGDLNHFEQRLKGTTGNYHKDSSDEDNTPEEDMDLAKKRNDPMWQLNEKNRILVDRLFKSEKELKEVKDTIDALASN